MQMRLSDLTSWRGVLDRGPFALWGLLLSIAKFGVDSLIVKLRFGSWMPVTGYWFPRSAFGAPLEDQVTGGRLFELMAVAVPFAIVGVMLTLKRLRSAGMPLWLVVLFFVPAVNLVFFLVLGIVPSRRAPAERPEGDVFDRFMPQGIWG